MTTPLRFVAILSSSLLSVACVSNPPQPDVSYAPLPPAMPEPAQATPGAIYQAGYDTRWFEDIRARRVGDILTVQLVEQTGASISNSTDVSRSSSASAANPLLFGSGLSMALPRSGTQGDLSFNVNASSGYSGSGDNEQSNQFSGSITVSVVEVLTNGYLRVRGEKRLGTNSGNEYVRLSGIIRPADIDTTNSVLSTRIADATLVYVGDGQIASSNQPGWASRFFNSVLNPF